MKIRISVSDEQYVSVKEYLSDHGIEISDDAEFMITESAGRSSFVSVKDEKKDRVNLAAEEIVYIES